MDLVYKNENKLYRIIIFVSIIIWLAFIAGTVGFALVYLFFGFIIYLFVHSGFISYLKGSGVRISKNQYPKLYQQYQQCCTKLELQKEPELYILNSDGILNSLATLFLKRHYVVLYSSILDALEKYPNSINFYIGHELGHIKRGHLNWTTLTWPGKHLPLIGAAYSRAREYTCDLHGLKCCDEVKDAAYGVAVLAAGPTLWSKLNVKEYMDQSDLTGSFWMSFHELTADYPWLSKRMKHIVYASHNKKPVFPKRSFFAGFLAFFIPRVGAGGSAGGLVSIMIVVAIIGILAAIALPAYQDYTVRAKIALVEPIGKQVVEKATPYILSTGELPSDLTLINLPNNLSNEIVRSVEVTDDGFQLNLQGHTGLKGKSITYQPFIDSENNLQWRCISESLKKNLFPKNCRE